MLRRESITLFLALLIAMSVCQSGRAEDRRPNIVFIMADDLGWTDTSSYGSKFYETPNIDRLAEQGLKLLNHHHCQNCAPTRAALMSGQYGARTGVYTVGGIERFNWQSRPLKPVENVVALPLDRDTVAEQLKASGYVTGMFGKWHLGNNGEYHPGQRGFDEAIVTSGAHFNFKTDPEIEVPKDTYLADFLTDQAVDFIARHKDQPFFLYLPHFGVHSPFQAKKELIDRFQSKLAVGGHHDPTYAAMIASVDESVGRLMQTLDDFQLADNTVLIFTSDNGGVGGYDRPGGLIGEPNDQASKKKRSRTNGDQGRSSVTDNAPLRSGKGSLYEGGTRVPLIVRWPGVTSANQTSNTPTIHVDLYPTFLEIGNAPRPQQSLDGESLVKLFRNPDSELNRKAIYQHFPGYLGQGLYTYRTTPVSLIQVGQWKLMQFLEDDHVELYDLEKDLGEMTNLASTMPEKATQLLEQLAQWRSSVQAPMPTPNDLNETKPTRKKAARSR